MMNKNMKRRPYAAPSAELVCLAPEAPIASWKWNGSDSRDWTQNSWGTGITNFKASITGVAEWLGDDLLTDEEKN